MDDTRHIVRTPVDGWRPGGWRLGGVLRMTLAGCVIGTLFAAHPVLEWAGGAAFVADRPAVQAVLDQAGRALDYTGLPDGFAWLRKQTRGLQAARFVPAQDAADEKQ